MMPTFVEVDLDKNAFGAWLHRFQPSELVNDPLDADLCPLRRYLLENGLVVRDDTDAVPMPKNMPVWAYEFLRSLQSEASPPYLASEAMKAYKSAVEAGRASVGGISYASPSRR